MADNWAQFSFFNVFPPREVMPKAKAAAEKALQIDDQLGEAHVSLGYVSFTYDFDWTAAGKHFDQALALNPGLHANPQLLSFVSQLTWSVAGIHRRGNQCLGTRPRVAQGKSHNLAVQLYLARTIRSSHRPIPQNP